MTDQEMLQSAMWMLGRANANNERAIAQNQQLLETNARLLAQNEGLQETVAMLVEVVEAYRQLIIRDNLARAMDSILARFGN